MTVVFFCRYSYPNVILSFIGGYLIDKVFGVRLGAIIFALFCLLGQVSKIRLSHFIRMASLCGIADVT